MNLTSNSTAVLTAVVAHLNERDLGGALGAPSTSYEDPCWSSPGRTATAPAPQLCPPTSTAPTPQLWATPLLTASPPATRCGRTATPVGSPTTPCLAGLHKWELDVSAMLAVLGVEKATVACRAGKILAGSFALCKALCEASSCAFHGALVCLSRGRLLFVSH